jgi:hypothetical protein
MRTTENSRSNRRDPFWNREDAKSAKKHTEENSGFSLALSLRGGRLGGLCVFAFSMAINRQSQSNLREVINTFSRHQRQSA